MEKITNCEIFYSGVIVVESRLEQCYYDYTSGREELAFDRIAEVVYDVEVECGINENIEVYLDEAIRVNETTAAKVSRQLMIIVNGICAYKHPKKNFQEDLLGFAIKAAKKIATTANWQVRIESGGHCIIVTPDDNEQHSHGACSSPLTPP